MSVTDLTFVDADGEQQVWRPRLELGRGNFPPLDVDINHFRDNPDCWIYAREGVDCDPSPHNYRMWEAPELQCVEKGASFKPYTIVERRCDLFHRRFHFWSRYDPTGFGEAALLKAIVAQNNRGRPILQYPAAAIQYPWPW